MFNSFRQMHSVTVYHYLLPFWVPDNLGENVPRSMESFRTHGGIGHPSRTRCYLCKVMQRGSAIYSPYRKTCFSNQRKRNIHIGTRMSFTNENLCKKVNESYSCETKSAKSQA